MRQIKQREKKGYWPRKILKRTGQLKRSIISRAYEKTAEVSTNLVYAAIHQYGGWIHRSSLKSCLKKNTPDPSKRGKNTPSPSKKGNLKNCLRLSSFYIPSRPFLKLNENDLNKIKGQILNNLILK